MKSLKLKILLIFTFIFLFPLVIGFIASLELPNIVDIPSGDLLAYYGTAFGIFSSFLVFLLEKKRKDDERDSKIKPEILLKLEKSHNDLVITLDKITRAQLTNIFINDIYISNTFNHKSQLVVNFKINNQNLYYNNSLVTFDDHAFNDDGIPKEIQVYCDDADKRFWELNYKLISNSDNINYYYYSMTSIQLI